MYFSFFPTVNSYPITIVSGDNTSQYSGKVSFGDIFRNISVVDIKKKHSFYYQTERIINSERPDQLSQRLYGTPNYFWTFFVINDHLRLGENLQWPLDENHLRRKLANDYCGKALISYKSRYILGFKPQIALLKDNTIILKQFEIGETIQGQQSGARGTLLLKNPMLGQLVVVPTTTQIQFKKGELILGLTSRSSLFIHDTIDYLDAPMFYVDENERECSHPNFIRMSDGANETQFTPVSAREHWFRVNDELSSIKVLHKSSLVKFDDAFRTLISSRQATTK
jgi:hypothetical protein